LIVNPYTRAVGAQTELHVNLFCSIGIRRPPCFGVATITVPPPPFRGQAESVKVTSKMGFAEPAETEAPKAKRAEKAPYR
jgi:hypothetical protein